MHHRFHAAVSTPSDCGSGYKKPSPSGSSGKNAHGKAFRLRKSALNRFRHFDLEALIILIVGGLFLLICGIWVGTKIAQSSVENYEDDLLPYNDKYIIPDSHEEVGDRSDRYVLFRKEYDESVEVDTARSLEFTKNLQSLTFDSFPFEAHHSDQLVDYDIYDCPKTPPRGYPFAWNAMDVLESWPINDLMARPTIYQGLCVFDYEKDYSKAMTYRNLELPFVVKNDPNIARTVERWNTPDYMKNMLGSTRHRTEYSENNHFMYSVPQGKHSKVPIGWKPSTELMRMSYREWLEHANVTKPVQPSDPHWYFRLIGCGYMGKHGECDKGSSEYLFDELPFFQPVNNLYVREPSEQKGIHCRFGMDGVIAENHFDAARNTIVLLGGSRRYLLSHPDQCESLALYPKKHPSARHSEVDWANPDLEAFPQFASAKINEVILQAGDAMYLPTHWFHYIVSLELNFQCNTRSGVGFEYAEPIQKCGFSTH